MERKLPIISIEGTDFLVDVENTMLREHANMENTISILHMKESQGGYEFIYDRLTKRMSIWSTVDEVRVAVMIPELVDLDPVGMSQKYGVPLEELKSKNDFEIMVDQEALRRRLDGELPTIEIGGHSFFVDIAADKLRPAGHSKTGGLSFTEIESCYDDEKEAYIITFNTKNGKYQPLDFEKLDAIPAGIVAVSIPFELRLDVIGFIRRYKSEEFQFLKEYNVSMQFKAQEVSWREFGLPGHVKLPDKAAVNLERKNEPRSRKRGRRL